MQKFPFFVGIGSAGRGWALGAGALGGSAGYVDFNNCNYDGIAHAGMARFHDSVVNGSTYVAGSATGTTTVFKGYCSFVGFVDLEDCDFNSSLSIVSPNATLRNCTTKDINVDNRSAWLTSNDLHLTDGTVVEGNITFKRGDGRVFLSGGACVLGAIYGADIVDTNNYRQNR